jgi:dolichol-phosphate mannosyltransferase
MSVTVASFPRAGLPATSAVDLSVIIPAYNEQNNLPETLDGIIAALRREAIRFEIVVVNDNSHDGTRQLVLERMARDPEIVLVNNTPPGGFGRAIRAGLRHFSGDAVAIVMADHSDDPEDIVRCYRTLQSGYDCVFGSRFRPASTVVSYPKVKLAVNRLVNRLLQVLFRTRCNDLTNAFKMYRRSAIEGIGPLQACHFNITIELSLSCVIRGYRIAEIPINWYGRTWGVSNLKLREMGRRYLSTLLKIWFERLLITDDVIAETAKGRAQGGARETVERGDAGRRSEDRVAIADV